MPVRSFDRFAAWRELFDSIEGTQEKAVTRLRQAGIADTHLLVVVQYFKSLQRSTLDDIEALFTIYEQLLVSHPEKRRLHDEWLRAQLTKVRLVYEDAVTELVVSAIRAVPKGVQQPVTYPVYPDWPDFLVIPAKILLWLLGFVACFIFVMAVSGQSVFFTALSPLCVLVAWVLCGLSTRGLLVPVGLIELVVIPTVIYLVA